MTMVLLEKEEKMKRESSYSVEPATDDRGLVSIGRIVSLDL